MVALPFTLNIITKVNTPAEGSVKLLMFPHKGSQVGK